MQKRSKNTIFMFSVVFIIILGIILSITIHPEMIMNGGSPGCGLESAPPGAFVLNQPESPDSDGIIYLDWTDSARVCHYNVYRHRIGSGDEKVVGGIDSTSFTDTVTENGNWYYKIDAYNRYGYGVGETWHTWSNLVLVNVEIAEPIPSAPIFNLILENPSYDGNFDFNWWSSAGATSYNVYKSVDNGVTYNLFKSGITGTGLLIGSSDSGLTNGNYWYKVTGINDAGESDYSNPQGVVVAIPNNLPTATITSITPNPATQGRDTITFTGLGSDTDGTIVAYQWLLADDTVLSNSDSFTKSADDFNIGDTTIYFRIKDNRGDWSAKVSMLLTIEEKEIILPPVAPYLEDIPTLDTDGTIELQWSMDENAEIYNVYRNGVPIETGLTTNSYTDRGRSDGTYRYKVTAVNQGGESDYSNVMVVVVSIPVKPDAPELYTIDSPNTDGTIYLQWSVVSEATSHNIYYSEDGYSFIEIAFGVTGNIYYHSGRTNGTYYYKVVATNDMGDSDYSNIQSVIVEIPPEPIPPEDLIGIMAILIIVIAIGITMIYFSRKLRKKVI